MQQSRMESDSQPKLAADAQHRMDNGDSSKFQNNKVQQTKPMLHWFETLSPTVQLLALASGVFFFFGIHNYLQEAIMSVPNFRFGVMLGWLEVFGVTVCSFFERKFVARETQRVAPVSAYPLLTFCLLSSSSLSNLALNFINFPTKVVFRSCKVSGHSHKHSAPRLYFFVIWISNTGLDWDSLFLYQIVIDSSFRQ